MKATRFEFRFRLLIMTVVIALGFWSPWIEAWGIGTRNSVLEALALQVSRLGLLSFTASAPAVILFGSVLAAVAAALRVWGTAYLGPATVQHSQLQAGAVMADGPYRYVRNPLYIGSWFMVAAMCFAMPPTGAAMVLTVVSLFLLRLVLAEEAFLAGKLGAAYQAYLNSVPRLIPRLRGAPPPTGAKPRWMHSLVSELNPIGVFVTLAVVSWSYSNWLMIKSIVISFGLSLVVKAFLPENDR